MVLSHLLPRKMLFIAPDKSYWRSIKDVLTECSNQPVTGKSGQVGVNLSCFHLATEKYRPHYFLCYSYCLNFSRSNLSETRIFDGIRWSPSPNCRTQTLGRVRGCQVPLDSRDQLTTCSTLLFLLTNLLLVAFLFVSQDEFGQKI